jgi:hypothetical protein
MFTSLSLSAGALPYGEKEGTGASPALVLDAAQSSRGLSLVSF